MIDFRSRLKPTFRRSSSSSSTKPDLSSIFGGGDSNWGRSSLRIGRKKKSLSVLSLQEEKEQPLASPPPQKSKNLDLDNKLAPQTPTLQKQLPLTEQGINALSEQDNPTLHVEQATPEPRGRLSTSATPKRLEDPTLLGETDARVSPTRPTLANRRHSPISFEQSDNFPFRRPRGSPSGRSANHTGFASRSHAYRNMLNRKIWVKRPNAIATQVAINEDDLVDDVKDMVLRKYANSIGKNFDPPDVSLKVIVGPHSSRHTNERILGPDENISKVLDLHYPGGQTIDEALLIDVPQKRTPKHSPRIPVPYYIDDVRPAETGTGYFPPMPAAGPQSPHLPLNLSATSVARPPPNPHPHPHSIAVLETGHVPNLPSPGAISRNRHLDRAARPRYGRQNTSSPTVIAGVPHTQTHDGHKITTNGETTSSPPIPDSLPHRTATPPPRNQSPRPNPKTRRTKKATQNGNGVTSPGALGGTVPPINVLIVEDNIINLKLLEAFLKRLNVRWQTAMNGEIAVNKWRQGGFHLVLMDIQLPVMNGLDATKEIRRLERVNKIGVFVNNAGSQTPVYEKSHEETLDGVVETGVDVKKQLKQEDNLNNLSLFKSPVIIVALTASSLQSDRHEALAAGCNDFLTKPVNFDWLSRKVMEWGCMQALIDFDGWRKWKDFSNAKTSPNDSKKMTNGIAGKSPKSPLMNGKQKKFLGILDGGNSSSEEKEEKVNGIQ